MNYGLGLTKIRMGLIAWAKMAALILEQLPTSIFSTCLLPPSQLSLGFCCCSQGILCRHRESAPPPDSTFGIVVRAEGLGWLKPPLLLLVAMPQLAVAITAAHVLLGACCCSATARRHRCCSSPSLLQLVAVARLYF
ncbi:hypothetical protein M9H77_03456 [Catharanthus roseus]|uniref:Uncharacterized protein n=1 Tax=Catharanthus roseus TaxID=4058 RepID=A0ACC0CBS7_CATRO|nr:hypothetical protein M9H77_03456 [Catharanthus roseus]